ncbi:hypothetical protein BCR34DRAFT_387222 [Clohesyomyces aquaticus]|uniref:Uncharacterized protein n=1 Tax=Clohesyomyces aquaticus TaxID=1231657 RepID=A0A1Y1ZFT6_9PLEO|nr:hypothetical protein BCR34DRAFT_387222 [Clohesyomyces aquaticus]
MQALCIQNGSSSAVMSSRHAAEKKCMAVKKATLTNHPRFLVQGVDNQAQSMTERRGFHTVRSRHKVCWRTSQLSVASQSLQVRSVGGRLQPALAPQFRTDRSWMSWKKCHDGRRWWSGAFQVQSNHGRRISDAHPRDSNYPRPRPSRSDAVEARIPDTRQC